MTETLRHAAGQGWLDHAARGPEHATSHALTVARTYLGSPNGR